MKWLKMLTVLLAVTMAGTGCGKGGTVKQADNEPALQETVSDNEGEDTAKTESLKDKDIHYVKNAVPYQAQLLNDVLKEIKLPAMEEGWHNYPVSTASIDGQALTMLELKLENRKDGQSKSGGIPLNIRIEPNDGKVYEQYKEQGFTSMTEGGKEYLAAPDGRKQIVFIDGDYVYGMDSVSLVMNFSGSTYSLDELIDIAERMTTDSEYKSYFELHLDNYRVPDYFVNDGKETFRIMVSYHDDADSQSFRPESQSLLIANKSARFEQWTPKTELDRDVYGEEVTLAGRQAVMDPNSYIVHLFNGDRLYEFYPPTEVSETSGAVMYEQPSNWQDEIAKMIESLNLPPQEDAAGTATTEEKKGGAASVTPDKESEMRRNAVNEVYSDALLDDSVFEETAFGFMSIGPEISISEMQDELFSRYVALGKDLGNLKLNDAGKALLPAEVAGKMDELVKFGGYDESRVFYLKDEIKGKPTLYWALAMVQSYEGYKVINVYDAENALFLTDL